MEVYMKNYITRVVFLACLFFILAMNGTAQPPGVVLEGTVIEEGTKAPLSFATVAVYESADSSMAANALTEEDGTFRLQVPPGVYYAVFQYVGYEDKVLNDLEVEGRRATIDLGTVTMVSDAVELQEVEVRAERSQMEFKLDKRVFNVGKDLTNAGNNAADVLDNVPSVTVDAEGNVSLRGSQSVRILVNGKPSSLMSAGDIEALRRMQGDIIESIEVITNPSARYEAEGEAGIINIILKKNEERGFNGSFGATLGYPQNYGASYTLNYRQSDLNFFSNFGINYQKSPGGGSSSQRFFENGVLDEFFTSEREQIRGGYGGNLQLGADWFIDEQTTLTGSLLYRRGRDNNEATVTYRDFDGDGNLLNTVVRENEEREQEHNFETDLNFRRTFDEPDRQWTIDFKYILDDDTELADIFQTSAEDPNPLIQRSSNTEDETNLLLQTDYIHPLGEDAKLEAGLRAALRTIDNRFLVEEQGVDGGFAPLPEFNDALRYTENIYAAYLIGAREFGDLSVQLGLRGELSDISAALQESNVVNNQYYFSLFPSAAVAYQLSEQDQLQMSYSRRLSRPFFRLLLPFSNYIDPRNNPIGNPNLMPEFTDSYEAGYLRYFGKGSFLTTAYYRRTTGVIERLTLPFDDGTTIEYPVNLAERDAYGLEFNFSYDLTDWWDLTSDLNFFRAIVDGEYEGVQYDADLFAWNAGLNSKVVIADKVDVQATFNYDSPRNNTQGRTLSSYALNLGVSVDILNGKGTLTLTGRDLFNTRIRRSIVELPSYTAESDFQWRQTRQAVLTFSYRLDKDRRVGSVRQEG